MSDSKFDRFYDLFEELCITKKTTPRNACIEMELGASTAAKWNYSDGAPHKANMRKVEQKFGVQIVKGADGKYTYKVVEKKQPVRETADADIALFIKAWSNMTDMEKESQRAALEVCANREDKKENAG